MREYRLNTEMTPVQRLVNKAWLLLSLPLAACIRFSSAFFVFFFFPFLKTTNNIKSKRKMTHYNHNIMESNVYKLQTSFEFLIKPMLTVNCSANRGLSNISIYVFLLFIFYFLFSVFFCFTSQVK